jgi:hypothetical protein
VGLTWVQSPRQALTLWEILKVFKRKDWTMQNLLPWWLTWIDGKAILFIGLSIWAVRKALISGGNYDQR